MDRIAKGRSFAIGVVVTACASAVLWTPAAASDPLAKSAPPHSYLETIYRPDCPTDEDCRVWQRCAVCDADRHP